MTTSSTWPYHALGQHRRPPLVFLHGFMGAGVDWLQVAQLLADRFFCIMPDLPGHGQNISLPVSAPLNFDTVVTGFNQFLEQLELDRISLVGYSMGGRLALYTALTFPQKITALVLEGASPGIAAEQARRERADLDDKRAETLLAEGLDAFVERWYELGLFRTLKNHPLLLAKTKEERKQNDPRWTAKIISDLSPGRQPPLWDRLDTLPMPVLLLAGALDPKYATLVTTMAEKIPDATTKIIPDAGHNTHLEHPEYFADLVSRFSAEDAAL